MIDMNPIPYEAFWQEVYAQHFPCYVHCSPAIGVGNPTYSRIGLDRIVHCGNGADYKIKEVNVIHALYPNIPIRLSTTSADRTRAELGWVYADFPIDKIAFGYCDPSGAMEKSGAFVLDYPAFQRAYLQNELQWRQQFEVVTRDWPDYTGEHTEHQWMLVPQARLLRAISKAQVIKCTSLSSLKRQLMEEIEAKRERETLAPLRISEAA